MKNHELIFASGNAHKTKEVQAILSPFKITDLNSLKFTETINEFGLSFAANAMIKAKFIGERYQTNCFADDSGIMVETLGNVPGVVSARYAGPNATDEQNAQKLLNQLGKKRNRKAKFVCCICFYNYTTKEVAFFEGELHGTIAKSFQGNNGFGYDPIFIPNGQNRTLAEYTADEKNNNSHRKLALDKFKLFLAQE